MLDCPIKSRKQASNGSVVFTVVTFWDILWNAIIIFLNSKLGKILRHHSDGSKAVG